MDRLSTVFTKKKPFVGFIVGGDGGVDYSVQCALALIEGGVDILEIGFPFSDPIADGPVIQRASQRALMAGTTRETLLEIGRRLRAVSNVPLILFSYYNPLLQAGPSFLQALKEAGFDGVLALDLPLEESADFLKAMQSAQLHRICVLTPSTGKKRAARTQGVASGFLYYACRKGTTGMQGSLPEDLEINLTELKSILPVVVGFGIADKASAARACLSADGFVVGSRFVELMERGVDPVQLKECARSIGGDDERNF